MINQRRGMLKKLAAGFAGLIGTSAVVQAAAAGPSQSTGHVTTAGTTTSASAITPEKEVNNVVMDQDVPLFAGSTKFNGMVFIAGKGAHFEGDIKAHTDHVLKELEKELIAAGSSMQKVLKVSVFLNDIADYQGMNEVYKGRFGSKPPVRTTVAVAKGGVPGNSLVEMDCIAYV